MNTAVIDVLNRSRLVKGENLTVRNAIERICDSADAFCDMTGEEIQQLFRLLLDRPADWLDDVLPSSSDSQVRETFDTLRATKDACLTYSPNSWSCTVRSGHKGLHVAHWPDGRSITAWTNDGTIIWTAADEDK